MHDNIQQEFFRIFKEKTPPGVNPVDLLTEIIPINKKAAYRRFKGEKPFTLNEVAKIATYLKISLDDILYSRVENPYNTYLIKTDTSEPFYEYYKMFLPIVDSLKTIKEDRNATFHFAVNRILNTQLFRYPALSKFRLFKYLYQSRKESVPKKMSEIVIPPHIRAIEETYCSGMQEINTCGLWTKDIFVPYVKDISYFSKIGLLSKEEIQLMKEELTALLDELRQITMHGAMKSGASFKVYLLNTSLDTSYFYIESETFSTYSTNIFGINLYSFSEPDFCHYMKEWFDSLLKYAVLISKSGVVDRTNFFKQQQHLLDAI
jgi:hypothetical protein